MSQLPMSLKNLGYIQAPASNCYTITFIGAYEVRQLNVVTEPRLYLVTTLSPLPNGFKNARRQRKSIILCMYIIYC